MLAHGQNANLIHTWGREAARRCRPGATQRLLADMTQDDVVFDGAASSCAVLQELIAARRSRTLDARDAEALRSTITEYAREFAASDFDIMAPDKAGVESAAAQNLMDDLTRFHRWKGASQVTAWKAGWPPITQALRAIGERQLQALRNGVAERET